MDPRRIDWHTRATQLYVLTISVRRVFPPTIEKTHPIQGSKYLLSLKSYLLNHVTDLTYPIVCFSFPWPSQKPHIFLMYWNLADNMFRLVALITYANRLINDHKSKLEYTNKLKTYPVYGWRVSKCMVRPLPDLLKSKTAWRPPPLGKTFTPLCYIVIFHWWSVRNCPWYLLSSIWNRPLHMNYGPSVNTPLRIVVYGQS